MDYDNPKEEDEMPMYKRPSEARKRSSRSRSRSKDRRRSRSKSLEKLPIFITLRVRDDPKTIHEFKHFKNTNMVAKPDLFFSIRFEIQF